MKLRKKIILPALTLVITLANFIFIINITNFFGVNNSLDINFLVYGVILFFAGQLGTLLSNSYIPYIRNADSSFGGEFNPNIFLNGFIFFITILSIVLCIIFIIAIPGAALLIFFYSLFLIILATNQLISIRIIETKDSYILVQSINALVSILSIITFHLINSLGVFSISLSLLIVHVIGSVFFIFHDDNEFNLKKIFVVRHLFLFLNFIKHHFKVLLCLSIFALASVIDVFFIRYLDDGDFSMHALSFRIILAATSVYYASFGIMFTNDITKKSNKHEDIKRIVKNVIITVTLISIFFNTFFYFLNDYQVLWTYIFEIPEQRINYFSQSLFYNSGLIFPMLAISYYFRFYISRDRINQLLIILFLWVITYTLSITILMKYDFQFLLQVSLNIAWWVCLAYIIFKELTPKYFQFNKS